MTKDELERLRDLLMKYSEWETELSDGRTRDDIGELIFKIDKKVNDAYA